MKLSEIGIASSLFIICMMLLMEHKSRFVFFIVPINIFIDVLTAFYVKGMILPITRASILLVFILFIWKNANRRMFYRSSYLIFVYFAYLILLLPFSSNILTSFSGYLKIFVTMMMFPIGFILVKNFDHFRKLNTGVLWGMVIFTLNFIVANIFKIGSNPYLSTLNFYTGDITMNGLNTGALFVLTSLSVISFTRHLKTKGTAVFLGACTLLAMVLSLRRGPLISLCIGLIIYFLFSSRRSYYIKGLIGFSVLILLFSPLYKSLFVQQYEARREQFQLNVYRTEYRYFETFAVIDEIVRSESLFRTLFGKEIFNSIGNYGGRKFGRRPLHVDYNVLLHGTGVIGLGLYILIFINIFLKFIREYKKNPDVLPTLHCKKMLLPLFLSFIVVSLTVALSGGLLAVTYRALLFLYLGSIIGIYNHLNHNVKPSPIGALGTHHTV